MVLKPDIGRMMVWAWSNQSMEQQREETARSKKGEAVMPELFWQQIGEVEAPALSPDGAGCVVGKLIIWKLNVAGGYAGLYAVGRSKETAIVTRGWDWKTVQAVIDVDQEQEMRWREHTARLTK